MQFIKILGYKNPHKKYRNTAILLDTSNRTAGCPAGWIVSQTSQTQTKLRTKHEFTAIKTQFQNFCLKC